MWRQYCHPFPTVSRHKFRKLTDNILNNKSSYWLHLLRYLQKVIATSSVYHGMIVVSEFETTSLNQLGSLYSPGNIIKE